MNEPASGSGDRNVEVSAVVANPGIVDAQEKRSRLTHREGFARADKEKSIGHNANRCQVGPGTFCEAGPCLPRRPSLQAEGVNFLAIQ